MGLDYLIQFRQCSSALLFCICMYDNSGVRLGFILFHLRLATGDPRAPRWHKLQPPSRRPEHVAENNIHL